jgi:hypothetical protein
MRSASVSDASRNRTRENADPPERRRRRRVHRIDEPRAIELRIERERENLSVAGRSLGERPRRGRQQPACPKDADPPATLGDKQTTVRCDSEIGGLVQVVGEALDPQRHAIDCRARRSGRPGGLARLRRSARLFRRCRRGHHGDVQGCGACAFEYRAARVEYERRDLQRVSSERHGRQPHALHAKPVAVASAARDAGELRSYTFNVNRVTNRRQIDRVGGGLIPAETLGAVDGFVRGRRLDDRRRRRRLRVTAGQHRAAEQHHET